MASSAPRGWYLARDVGQLAGVSGTQIGQWARHGLIRSSRGAGNPRAYSFQDVAEAMVVHELIDRGLPAPEIRRAIANLRERYGDWPLIASPLSTTVPQAGRVNRRSRVVLCGRDGDCELAMDGGRGDGNQTYLPTLTELQNLSALLRRGGWVMRDLPHVTHIEVDPDRLSGRPTIRNRRIPAEKVALLAETAEGRQILRSDYKLSGREIDDAARWYAAVSHFEAAA